MKIAAKNLFTLFLAIGIISISGCIDEKQEFKTIGGGEKEHKQQLMNPPQNEINREENVKEDSTEEIDETESQETEIFSDDMGWCKDDLAVTITECPKTRRIWTMGVLEFKGKLMCHAKYFVASSEGERLYDWYFTKDEKEIYRVITYLNGSVEETKIERSKEVEKEEYNLNEDNIARANKPPSEMVLKLRDLPGGYNILYDKTGETTRDEHTYSPEKLRETGWDGGYKTAFENERLYLFNLDLDYKQYLEKGDADEHIKKAFDDKEVPLLGNAKIYKIDNTYWRIQDESLLQNGNMRYYIIEETRSNLKIYEKSLSRLSNYRFIFNTNSVYDADKIREVFNDAKQTMSASLVFVSAPEIGSECVLYKKELTEDNVNYTAYSLIFRKLNVYEEIQIIGLSSIVEEDEVIDLAKIVEKKVE